jgi:hypothetical protein
MLDQACRAIAETASAPPGPRTLPTGQRNVAGILASLSGPVSVQQDNARFDEAMLALPTARPPGAPNSPSQSVAPSQPVMLTGPSPLLVPGH